MKKIINIPEVELAVETLTKEKISSPSKFRVLKISREFSRGFKFIKKYPKSITFFGSARLKEDNIHYQQAKDIARKLSKRGYAIVTGGGPGIMEAANRGAYEEEGESIGLNIELPMEQVSNPYVKTFVNFYYFFSRKVMLTFSAEAYLYFPGGYGTLDEFFEILTLIQTHKIEKLPIILIGSDFWNPVDNLIKEHLLAKHNTISPEDEQLYTITNNTEEVLEIIKNATKNSR